VSYSAIHWLEVVTSSNTSASGSVPKHERRDGGDELGIHGVHQVDETGAADHSGRVSAVVKDVGQVGS
jgi:hypothetical protein